MIPIATLKMIDHHIKGAKRSAKEYSNQKPCGYVYMQEALKQIRKMVELEFMVMNKANLN